MLRDLANRGGGSGGSRGRWGNSGGRSNGGAGGKRPYPGGGSSGGGGGSYGDFKKPRYMRKLNLQVLVKTKNWRISFLKIRY